MDAATRGIALAQSGLSYALKALLMAHEPTGGKFDEARIAAETAYRLNPQDSSVIAIYAQILIFAGDPLQAIQLLKRALRINPRDPMAYNIYSELAQAHVVAGDYAGGLEWAMRARNAAPGYVHAHLLMAMVQVGLGNLDKAKAALEDARRIAPELVRRRLEAKPSGRGNTTGHRFDILLRIAAGLEDPGAAVAFASRRAHDRSRSNLDRLGLVLEYLRVDLGKVVFDRSSGRSRVIARAERRARCGFLLGHGNKALKRTRKFFCRNDVDMTALRLLEEAELEKGSASRSVTASSCAIAELDDALSACRRQPVPCAPKSAAPRASPASHAL